MASCNHDLRSRICKLYIDGDLDFENEIVDYFPDFQGEFNIGRSTETYGGAFDGSVRNIQIWNVALEETEIQVYMDNPPLLKGWFSRLLEV